MEDLPLSPPYEGGERGVVISSLTAENAEVAEKSGDRQVERLRGKVSQLPPFPNFPPSSLLLRILCVLCGESLLVNKHEHRYLYYTGKCSDWL